MPNSNLAIGCATRAHGGATTVDSSRMLMNKIYDKIKTFFGMGAIHVRHYEAQLTVLGKFYGVCVRVLIYLSNNFPIAFHELTDGNW
jgi:hypothetical protein